MKQRRSQVRNAVLYRFWDRGGLLLSARAGTCRPRRPWGAVDDREHVNGLLVVNSSDAPRPTAVRRHQAHSARADAGSSDTRRYGASHASFESGRYAHREAVRMRACASEVPQAKVQKCWSPPAIAPRSKSPGRRREAVGIPNSDNALPRSEEGISSRDAQPRWPRSLR